MKTDVAFASIRLYVPELALVRDFYEQSLGLDVLESDNETVCFRCGRSKLCFQQRATATPYHFAINIPSRQEAAALSWLRERVAVQAFTGEDIVDFPNWQAKAIYFYDPAGNIVELIARRELNYPDQQPFSAEAFLEVSELGVGTSNIESVYRSLQEATGITIYDGSFERFCAIGEPTALFITVDYRSKKWFPVDDPVHASPFQATLLKGEEVFQISYENEQRLLTA